MSKPHKDTQTKIYLVVLVGLDVYVKTFIAEVTACVLSNRKPGQIFFLKDRTCSLVFLISSANNNTHPGFSRSFLLSSQFPSALPFLAMLRKASK